MKIEPDIQAARQLVNEAKRHQSNVGFVPTMGALHEGHASLIKAARNQCDYVIVSIFVNPTQFGPSEDFDAYPRTLETDQAICESLGVDLIFDPTIEAMYGEDSLTTIHVAKLTEGLCGQHRPGHFDGVTTIVAKLFQAIPCDFAFFGEKDFQQLVVIRRMVRDLDIPVEIVACPTVREPDGLAMSSRNAYLSESQRRQALSLHRALRDASARIKEGERDVRTIKSQMEETIREAGRCTIDYIEVVEPESLTSLKTISGPVRICLAVRIGSTRLIDNISVDASAADE